jgi:iron complex outermembrane receptor protein
MHVINDNETKDNDSGQDNKSETYYGEYQFQKKIEPIKLNWTSGIVFEYVNAKSELFQGNNFRENTALFTQLDKKLGQRINLSAGARYERFKLSTGQEYIIDGTKINEIIDSKPVFRSGINYQLAKATYLRSSFGQGYRFPSIAELFIKTEVASGIWVFENPALKPEHGWSSEIAVKQGYKIGKWKGYADLALFIMEYQDMMEFTFSQWDDQEEGVIPGLGFKSINIGETRISGTEFTIVGTGKIRDVEINFLGGYTYIKPISLEPNKILNNDESLNYISSSSDTSNLILKYRYEHLAKIDVEIKHQKSSLGVSLRYNSFMQNIDGFFVNPFFAGLVPGIVESRESLNKGDFLMDIRLQQFFNNGANISLIINNALNTEYQTRPANLMAPRMISLKWGFKI